MARFLFIIALVFILPFIVGEAKAIEYHNTAFNFTIDYPKDWVYDDELFISEGQVFPVSFYDKKDEYGSSFDISIIEGNYLWMVGTDQQRLEFLSNIYQQYCDASTFEKEGYVCENFKIEFTRVLNFDKHKEYEIKTTWEQVYPDDTYFEPTDIIRVIPSNSGTWYLYSETLFKEDFPKFEDLIYSMMGSFTLPDSELILKDNSSLITESGLYVNDKFNFSIIPPTGWIIKENMQVEQSVLPVSFYNPNYSGLMPPSIIMVYTKFNETEIKYYDSENDALEEFKKQIIQVLSSMGFESKTTFENIETSTNSTKYTLRLEITQFVDEKHYAGNSEIVAWVYPSGDTFVVLMVTEDSEFEENYPAFRKSVNSFNFFGNANARFDSNPIIPDWIRNNAKWWADDLINDSDFVAGLEYLIKTGTIKVQTTKHSDSGSDEIPSWIKTNARWWSEKKISDEDFIKGIQFMIESGVIQIEQPKNFSSKDNI